MKSRIMYVELKSGYADNGPAWIGNAYFSRTMRTVYSNGKAFKKAQGIMGNYIDIETGDEYWISGVKKRGWNRHWAGSGKIKVDKSIVEEYLDLGGYSSLSPAYYEIVKLDNTIPKEKIYELENKKL